MKNANYIETIVSCYACKQGGFFCTTPFGGDYHTCPLCDEMNDAFLDIDMTREEEDALENKLKSQGITEPIVDFIVGQVLKVKTYKAMCNTR
jgi:hypothetical protein